MSKIGLIINNKYNNMTIINPWCEWVWPITYLLITQDTFSQSCSNTLETSRCSSQTYKTVSQIWWRQGKWQNFKWMKMMVFDDEASVWLDFLLTQPIKLDEVTDLGAFELLSSAEHKKIAANCCLRLYSKCHTQLFSLIPTNQACAQAEVRLRRGLIRFRKLKTPVWAQHGL